MEYSPHSGHCCGISVVHGFDDATVDDLDRVLARHDAGRDHGAPGNRLLEAVLTDRQLDPQNPDYNRRVTQQVRDQGGWGLVLASRGFRLHTRFRNSNSGRYCNVFHRIRTAESLDNLPWLHQPQPVNEVRVTPINVNELILPLDWETSRAAIFRTHDGRAVRVVEYNAQRHEVRVGPVANDPAPLLLRNIGTSVAGGWFKLSTGEYSGAPASAGSLVQIWHENRLLVPVDWRRRNDSIFVFQNGERMNMVDYSSIDGGRVRLEFIENRRAPRRMIRNLQTPAYPCWYDVRNGQYSGAGYEPTAGAARNATRPANIEVAERAPVATPPVAEPVAPPPPQPAPATTQVADEIPWSTTLMTADIARAGLRVKYQHREGLGTSERLHNREGEIVSVNIASNTVDIRWNDTEAVGRHLRLNNRFLWDTRQIPQAVPPAEAARPQPAPAPEPVLTERVQFFAVRRDGTRAGPFITEEEARRRWSRVGRYVRVTSSFDGDTVVNQVETEIAA